MTTPWLDVIGIGEDGLDGLAPAARARLEAAEVIVGGPRHHALVPELAAERIEWPSPFRELAEELETMRGRRVAVLVTGDPLWYSAGALYQRRFSPEEILYHPQLSAFQLAAVRMKWSLADVETLTIHGRPAEQAIPYFGPGQRLLILTEDGSSPATIARLLTENGLGPSRLTVLGAMGGPGESRIEGTAADWNAQAPDFHLLAVECIAAPGAHVPPRTGLPDDAFTHDGKMTKREIRALTLSALAPRRGELLWDIGLGCGSVAIEWMRADRDMRAIGLEPSSERRAMAAANATRLGAPRLDIRPDPAPAALAGLPAPDAIFIGGGLSEVTAEAALDALKPGGRLVANAVTLESEAVLATLYARHGGDLTRIAISRAQPVGRRTGWKPAMPVTQWSLSL
ncbi:precorrin-6y C5,15-methyltransferase (decarboxylating) subunit CbiE [Tropicimonas sp. IMCC6043]|uniref:precorrin-6y C5,15-methyltransferase (decarboxylating) subunit CbiE n=1 Tax=Tropicimonas sp. IMCC6043 TaxID=2510645 RepID=UPI00101C1BBF|nr:precorrin-6y C5,15-methyltransferase (decarboxylating) subunit CbiE [Tropicimonas sp. IMCC6043]RYH09334.1 precorrin-6y C5,15-methyltransferase (decarboxylating) subunit CbiE [Tropicimonas sp. IMCC6043]